MTDAEKREKVIKGLECCAFGDCTPCPYTETRCQEHLCGDALGLIKEQKGRIKRLLEAGKILSDALDEKDEDDD